MTFEGVGNFRTWDIDFDEDVEIKISRAKGDVPISRFCKVRGGKLDRRAITDNFQLFPSKEFNGVEKTMLTHWNDIEDGFRSADIYKLIDPDRFPLLTQILPGGLQIERFIRHFKKALFNFAALTFLICSLQRVLLIILNFCWVFLQQTPERFYKIIRAEKIHAGWILVEKISNMKDYVWKMKIHYGTPTSKHLTENKSSTQNALILFNTI